MTLFLQARSRLAQPGEVEAAFVRLDDAAGLYFGCDAGVAGLHPLQATLLTEPAVAFRLYDDGAEAQACNAWGESLLRQPALAACSALLGRRAGRSPLPALRAFLAAFGGLPEAILLGAFGFDAHRLARIAAGTGVASPMALGTFYFGPRYWQRDASGNWRYVELIGTGDTEWPPVQTQAAAPSAPAVPVPAAAAAEPRDDFPPGGYAEIVARAVQWLRDTPLVSLTLSQSFRRRVALPPSGAFARLRQSNPAPASFFLNSGDGACLFGASPDLQLVLRGRSIEALPVCGTVRRREGASGEAESFRELLNEEVDAASLAVCSDALGNDLAPLCEPGSMHLLDRRRPMALSTVVHTVDRLRGRLRDGIDAWDAIVATAAPVMLTGTPRALALQGIARFEAGPRGWYGGMVVRVAADGDALVGTILRAAAVRQGVAEVRTGGDLLADSDPEREERESRLKAISLWRAFGLADEPATQQPPAGESVLPTAVALCDGGDPFPAAVEHRLRGLGLVLDTQAGLCVLIGADEAACSAALGRAEGRQGLVALGDAAARVLGAAGFSIAPIPPEHGRLLHGQATPEAPWTGDRSFLTARYATLALRQAEGAALPPDWQVWAHDAAGQPVALAHAGRRLVCLLFRPDSLLSDAATGAVLRSALAFASRPAP